MKHKTELRKGLARVTIDGAAAAAGHRDPRAAASRSARSTPAPAASGLAYLRFDRAEGEMTAGEARVVRDA